MPASSFCEPNGDVKPATWNWFALKGDDPRPLFAFAGVWRRHRGPLKKDGPVVELVSTSEGENRGSELCGELFRNAETVRAGSGDGRRT